MVAVADPGFPRGGDAHPKGGVQAYYLANFSQKLHENEEFLGQIPLRFATGLSTQLVPLTTSEKIQRVGVRWNRTL